MLSLQMQESKNDLDSLDFLNLRSEPKFIALLESNEQLILSTTIWKYNSDNKCQQRILVLTNIAILNIIKTENIIKSLMKKLINFQNKFTLRRRIPLNNLYGITVTPNRNSNIFLIHVNNEHDYHYQAQNNKMLLLKLISEEYKKITKKPLPFFFKDQLIISNYCTFKGHLKDKKQVKPKDNPHYLSNDYFYQRKFQNQNYICEFTQKGEKILPQNFSRIELANLRQGEKYYILKEEMNRSIRVINLNKNAMLLNPSFSFYSQKKQLLFTHFMIGGNFKTYIQKKLPLTNQDIIFYMSQLINFIQSFHSSHKIYGNLILQNILVKQNGYLILNGLSKSIINNSNQKLFYGISRGPFYLSPEQITCRGYNKQIDIWKLGICGYYMCKGSFPFEGYSIKDLYFNIINKSFDEKDVPAFIIKMLQKDKTKRISVQQLKKQQEFKNISWQALSGQRLKSPSLPHISNWQGKLPIIYRLQSPKQNSTQ